MSYEEKLHQIDVVCDLVLAIAYYLIPLQLIYFLRQFPAELPWKCHVILILFACFILLCGTTHLVHVLGLNILDMMIVKLLASTVSAVTSMIIWWVFRGALEFVRRARQVELDMFHQSTTVRRAQEFMKESQQNRNDFLAVLSHELRNCLNVTVCNAAFLLDTSLSAEQREHVLSIESSGKLMTTIMNDVLDISRLQAGKMTFEKEVFSLFDLCKQVVRNQKQAADEKHIDMVLEYDDTAPHAVVSDAVRVQQVLINLLSNAIKFTITGSVTLRVSAVHVPEINEALDQERRRFSHENKRPFEDHAKWGNYFSTDKHLVSEQIPCTAAFQNMKAIKIKTRPPPSNSSSSLKLFEEVDRDGLSSVRRAGTIHPAHLQITFQVIDTGVGINANAMPSLFVPYKQCKLSTVRESGGNGLGLSIIHQIVSNLRGSIYVVSELAVGSMFVIQLQLQSLTLEQFKLVNKPVELPPVPLQRPSGSQAAAALKRQNSFSGRNELPQLRRSPPSLLRDRQSSGSNLRRNSFSDFGTRSLSSNHRRHSHRVSHHGPRGTSDSSLAESKKTLLKTVLMNQQSPVNNRRASAPCVAAPIAPPGTGQRLLLVEDNNINLRILQRMISSILPGAQLDTASDGLKAVEAVSKKHAENILYSLIIMDLNMPVMDGYQATQHIRHSGRSMPIIALTGNVLESERLKAEAVGMSDFTTKPINKLELTRLLNKWLNMDLHIPKSTL